MASESTASVDAEVLPLDAPQADKKVKGLFPRSSVFWGLGLFIVFLIVMFIRDVIGPAQDSQAQKATAAAAAASSVPLGPESNERDIDAIAERQMGALEAARAASAAVAQAEASREQQRGQATTVQPAVPYPTQSTPMGSTASSGGGVVGGAIDAGQAQADVERRSGAIVALQGEEEGGLSAVKAALEGVRQSAGAPAAGQSGGADDFAKTVEAATRQVQGLMRTSGGGEGPGQVLNAVAQVAHPTTRDVGWLKEYGADGRGSDAQGLASVTRAKRLPTANVVLQGTRVPAVSQEAINSDQPGEIRATSTNDIYDSLTQSRVLIPKGTRFIGRYSSEIRPGQTRLLFAFNRMILPDGRTVDLTAAQGVDNLGRAGVEGTVDNHFLKMFGYSMAIAWIGSKAGNGGPTTSTVGPGGQVATSTLTGQVLGQVAQQILSRNSSIPPTLKNEPAVRLFITMTADIGLEPWESSK